VPLLSVLFGASSPAAAAAAAAAAASCPGANALPAQLSTRQLESATACMINAQRKAHGLAPVRPHRLLRRAALSHSRDMVRQHYFSHTSQDGGSFVARIRATGYLRRTIYWHVGETLAWAAGRESSPGAIVRGWMQSPPHRRTILTSDFRSIGVGAIPGSPQSSGRGATYTADFGYRRFG
jgi:uncharacterized protein YkwD